MINPSLLIYCLCSHLSFVFSNTYKIHHELPDIETEGGPDMEQSFLRRSISNSHQPPPEPESQPMNEVPPLNDDTPWLESLRALMLQNLAGLEDLKAERAKHLQKLVSTTTTSHNHHWVHDTTTPPPDTINDAGLGSLSELFPAIDSITEPSHMGTHDEDPKDVGERMKGVLESLNTILNQGKLFETTPDFGDHQPAIFDNETSFLSLDGAFMWPGELAEIESQHEKRKDPWEQAADPEKFPFHALLKHTDFYICGGIIIGDSWIITAGQCVSNHDPWLLEVAVGAIFSPERQMLKIRSVYLHKNFTAFPEIYDLALIRTLKNIKFGPTVAPAKVVPSRFKIEDKMEVMVSGYGTLTEGRRPHGGLRARKMSIVGREICKQYYPTLNESQVCAVCDPTDIGCDCQADVGGPLTTMDGRVIGMTLNNIGCASGAPGVYTKVSHFLHWIRSIVGQSRPSKHTKSYTLTHK